MDRPGKEPSCAGGSSRRVAWIAAMHFVIASCCHDVPQGFAVFAPRVNGARQEVATRHALARGAAVRRGAGRRRRTQGIGTRPMRLRGIPSPGPLPWPLPGVGGVALWAGSEKPKLLATSPQRTACSRGACAPGVAGDPLPKQGNFRSRIRTCDRRIYSSLLYPTELSSVGTGRIRTCVFGTSPRLYLAELPSVGKVS